MELCSDGTLRQCLVAGWYGHESAAVLVTRQILCGVQYLAESNLIHCDLKTDNILVANASQHEIKICDFGLAVECCINEFCELAGFGTTWYTRTATWWI